jgi:hypothetical protein
MSLKTLLERLQQYLSPWLSNTVLSIYDGSSKIPEPNLFSIPLASRKELDRTYSLLPVLVHPSTPPHTLFFLFAPYATISPSTTPSKITIKGATFLMQPKLLVLMTRFSTLTFRPYRVWKIKSHSLRDEALQICETSLVRHVVYIIYLQNDDTQAHENESILKSI